jgi:hypothetical protein
MSYDSNYKKHVNRRRIYFEYKYWAALLLIALFAIVTCSCDSIASNPEIERSFSEEPSFSNADNKSDSDGIDSSDLLQQMDALYQQLDTSRCHMQEFSYWLDTDTKTLDELPKQLVIDTQEAYRYAQIIGNYLYFSGNTLHDFDDAESMYMPSVIQTAIYRTTPSNGVVNL